MRSKALLLAGLSMVIGPALAAEQGAYLFDALKSPDFAKPYAQVIGAAKLPAWVKQGGTATPGEQLSMGGKAVTFYSGCKPHDCPTEQILVLHDASSGRVVGLFVHNEGAMMSPDITTLKWLGKPSDAERRTLIERLRVD